MGTTTWPAALAGYRAHQLAANRSPGTIRLHRWRLMDLAMKTRTPAAVTLELLRTILGTPTWAPETRKSVRSTYRSFFSWAYDEGLVAEDPSRRLPTITVPRALPRPAPEAVLVGALEAWRALAPASRGTTLDVELMLLLAGYAGLRAHEIAKVHRSHLYGDELRVVGKGRKERLVPVVHPLLLARLDVVDGWAFPNRWTGAPVTAGRVTRLVSGAMPAGWTCHTLRHRMATQAYAGTRDLLAVGALLGHSRPETTQRYVLLPRDAMRAAVAAAA